MVATSTVLTLCHSLYVDEALCAREMHVTFKNNCIPLTQLDVREVTRPSSLLEEGVASDTKINGEYRARPSSFALAARAGERV